MAKVVRIPLNEAPPEEQEWIVITPEVDGHYRGQSNRPGSKYDYAPETTTDLEEAIRWAVEWADAQAVPTVYVQHAVAEDDPGSGSFPDTGRIQAEKGK